MNRQKKTLLITALLFATPVILAVVMHNFPGLITLGTKNNGTLITPARPLESLSLTVGGQTAGKALVEGKWTWTTLIEGKCDTACNEQLYKSRQVRLALGKDMDKGQRLLVQVGTPVAIDPALLEAHPDLIIASADSNAAWLTTFHLDDGKLDTGHLYLVDPLGNLMMYYPQEIEGPMILKDIQRLVRVSWIKPK
jgi:hypothetical protein